MARKKGTSLSIEDKLEIRRLNRTKNFTQTDIAKKYDKSRETINLICHDDSLVSLDNKIIEKENLKLQETFVPRMIATKMKLLNKIDELIETEDNMARITIALKEFNNNIQLLSSQPTEIKRKEIVEVDVNKLVDSLQGNPDDIAKYLLGNKRAADIVEVDSNEV